MLSAKYFPDGDIFRAKHVDKSSFAWSSIATTVRALDGGFGWHIGDGRHARVGLDK